MIFTGRVWKFGNDINTDLMMPGEVFSFPVEQQARQVFRANRPGWVDQVREGDILIGGRNFGTGSSRPAARLLRHLGITCVVAESINGLFFRNCVNFALAPMTCAGITAAFKEGEEAAVDFIQGVVTHVASGRVLQGEALPDFLQEIIATGGTVERLRSQGFLR